MEFKNQALVETEVEVAAYLLQNFSLNLISEKTGLSKKILRAHLRNMMEKLNAKDTKELIRVLKQVNT
jgi:DNA-binding CsgD family transcriptional regulator